MKKISYLDKTRKDLLKALNDKRQSLRQFYFSVAGSKVTNVKEARNLRKEVARILTELHRGDKKSKV